ncbi:MAG: SurA N-terminal domain-containing protein [Candidatus Omnitrophica bacterium]|nr:SurA N-terminal domain-containing protein [Candidatus Omnitrophota bacterium]
MLNHLRKNTRVICWLIVGSFVIWGVGSAVFTGLSGGGNTAGKVFGKRISNQEFNRHLKLIRIFGGPEIETKDAASVEALTWEQIALSIKAKREGIKVTDEEVQGEILKRMAGPQAYDPELYGRWVQNVFQEGPRVFEEKIRDLVAIQKLLDQIPVQVTLTDESLKKKYFAVHPEAKPEEFEKMKEGYRSAMTELAKRETKRKYINQIIREANIRSFLEDRRKAEEKTMIETPIPGSPQPLRTPIPKPISKEATSTPSKSD